MNVYSVFGPPGTGKTTELMRRIDDARNRGYSPSQIAFISHTRAAAAEALSRLGITRSDLVSTIHSLVFRLQRLSREQVVDIDKLREFSNAVGVPISGKNPGLDERLEIGDEFLAIIALADARCSDPYETYQSSTRPGNPALFKMFDRAYKGWKRVNGYVDFSDMLRGYVDNPIPCGAKIWFIDEAQDLSGLQWRVINRLTQGADEIHIAGDDDQAIYVWGGANPRGMVEFENRHGAQRSILDKSWRVPRAIHKLAHKVVARISDRVEKHYLPRDEDGELNYYGHLGSLPLDSNVDTLVLFRNHAIRRDIEDEIRARGLPYRAEGGYPGLMDNRYGRTIKAWVKLQQGRNISSNEMRLLEGHCKPSIRNMISSRRFDTIIGLPWEQVLVVPGQFVDYYRMVTKAGPEAVLGAPKIKLSSIHASKGRQADRVILMTGTTERTNNVRDTDNDGEARVFYVGVTRAKCRLDIVEGENAYPL